MRTDKSHLICVDIVYDYTQMNEEFDAFLYFDSASLAFVVIEGSESAIPPNVNRCESDPIPASKFVKDNTKYAEKVCDVIIRKLTSVK
jgi:hypothetical protein